MFACTYSLQIISHAIYMYILHLLLCIGGSTLEPGWSQDHPNLEKKSLLYIKFKNFMFFLPLKKCVIILNYHDSSFLA